MACQPQCLANTCSCHCSVVTTTGSAFTGKTIQAPLRIWSSSGPVVAIVVVAIVVVVILLGCACFKPWCATGTADWTTVAVVAVCCSTVSQTLVVWVVWVVWVFWVALVAWDFFWFPAVGI